MITRDELREELTRFPTRDELREELKRFPTRDELHEELKRFPTRDELRAELAHFATKDDLKLLATKDELAALREETAGGFADLRRYMEILYEDLKGMMRFVIEANLGRMDARDVTVDRHLADHDVRIAALDGRVARIEHPRKR